MIVQACLNGARPADYHPQLPLTIEAMVRDALACIRAGASEIHVHPRDAAGNESLSAVDDLMIAMRRACPGTLVGVSTGEWIENDREALRRKIAAWRVCPDYASVNLSEHDAPAIMSLLRNMGIGVEAGLASIADAERFVALSDCQRVLRVLIEIEEQNAREAAGVADQIYETLVRAGIRRPVLLHGFDATVWQFIEQARDRLWSTRIGFEDTRLRADGSPAGSNAELIADAVDLMHSISV